MLVVEERGKQKHPEKNLDVGDLNPGYTGGRPIGASSLLPKKKKNDELKGKNKENKGVLVFGS